MFSEFKFLFILTLVLLSSVSVFKAQELATTEIKVQQLLEKKAEYHRLTDGEQDGYRIKIHFSVERDKAKVVRSKFAASFENYLTYEEYQQPNWVVLVGDYKTKLEAFEVMKKIQVEFPNSFIVKSRIKVK